MILFVPVFAVILAVACGLFVAFFMGLICWIGYLTVLGTISEPPKDTPK